MLKPSKLNIREVSWQAAYVQLMQVRQQVFIDEQQVPLDLEWDGLDEAAVHILATHGEDVALGCARIIHQGSIGRMAVLKAYRGCGIGQALLQAAIAICKQNGWNDISLSAQTHAIQFYEKAGFYVCSKEYLDANIPHVDMKLK